MMSGTVAAFRREHRSEIDAACNLSDPLEAKARADLELAPASETLGETRNRILARRRLPRVAV
jgi:hypothetical protein